MHGKQHANIEAITILKNPERDHLDKRLMPLAEVYKRILQKVS
jgi:hypothetical protein